MSRGKKTLFLILISLLLTSTILASALGKPLLSTPQATTCVDTDNKKYTIVTAYASIYNSLQGTTGTGSARASETFYGSTVYCVDPSAYVNIHAANGEGWIDFIDIPGSVSQTFYYAGEYVETYIKSLCDGATAFTGAFINGYCALSSKPIQPSSTLSTLLSE